MNPNQYKSKSGHFAPVYTLEIQTLIEDVDKILDAIVAVYPLSYGRYKRNASISAEGIETSQPEEGSTTTTHLRGYKAGEAQTYSMVELKISIERDLKIIKKVMEVIHYVHHYEEPVIFLREDWVSRASYNPDSRNPNRWWNNGKGIPNKINGIEGKND